MFVRMYDEKVLVEKNIIECEMFTNEIPGPSVILYGFIDNEMVVKRGLVSDEKFTEKSSFSTILFLYCDILPDLIEQ